MFMKRFLAVIGIYAMAEGFYRLLTPPQLINDVNQAAELVKKAMDFTLFNMGLVVCGGLLILIALFMKR